jgi:endonuclease YncB( thermonuclease family)
MVRSRLLLSSFPRNLPARSRSGFASAKAGRESRRFSKAWTPAYAGVTIPVFLLALLLAPVAAQADAPRPGPTAVVAEVVDGDTVVLGQPVMEARQVRLVGLQAPKLPLGRPNFPVWPLADESKRALEAIALGKPVRLSFGGSEKDRHGRLLAHLHLADGEWVQGRMLAAGMARVYSFADNRTLVAEMLALEREARAGGRGIWGHPFYAVRGPREAAAHIGTFQLVEGRVVKAAKVKGTVYLNFGKDWRSDFTAAIDGEALKLFRGAGVDPLAFEGERVRVRGWLKQMHGPLIAVTHPEQIEAVRR